MVTCQPVNVGGSQQTQSVAMATEQNLVNGHRDSILESALKNDAPKSREFEAKDLEFDCIGDTFCCTSETMPLKVTIPAQDTVLLTGLQADMQVLIHKQNDEKRPLGEEKYSPLHRRVLMSHDSYKMEDVETVVLRRPQPEGGAVKTSESYNHQEPTRSNFKEEKSIPMKKRIVFDQDSAGMSSPHSNSPQQSYPPSRSPPPSSYPPHGTPPRGFPTQMGFSHQGHHPTGMSPGQSAGLSQAPAPLSQPHFPLAGVPSAQMHSGMAPGLPSVPTYRDRFPDGWGYFPLQKRQKFGIHSNGNSKEQPLDLIKQP